MRTSLLALALTTVSALTACGDSSPTTSPTTDASTTGGSVAAVCALARSLSCPSSATCERDLMSLWESVPARCVAQRDAFFSCAAGARSSTCAMIASGQFAGCQTQYAALGACVDTDASTTPTDASTASSAPSPNDWALLPTSVTLTLEGAGETTARFGNGTATLGIGPIGSPANAHIATFSSMEFPVGNASLDCRVGLIYSASTGTYAFSGDPLLTAPCVVTNRIDGSTTTLTFSGATVTVGAAPLNTVSLRVSLTGAGALAMGAGTLQITWTPQ